MQLVALGWLVFDITNSSLYLGLVGLARGIPVFFFSLFGGTMADRLNRRNVMLWTQSSMGLMALLLALLTFANVRDVWLILGITVVTSSLTAFDAPVRQSLVPELVPKEQLPNAIGLNNAQFNAAAVIGPSIAGMAIAFVGPAVCFLLNSLSFMAILYVLVKLKHLGQSRPRATESVWRNFVAGMSYLRHAPLLLNLLLIVLIPSLLARPYIQLMPLFARDVLHSDSLGLGFLTAANGIGAVGGGILAAQSHRFKRRGLVVLSAVTIFAVALLGFAYSPWFWLSIGLLVIIGWMLSLYAACVNTLLQTTVPDEFRGRVLGMYMLVNFGFMPLGTMLIGAVGAIPGLSVPLVLAGGCVITLVIIAMVGWSSKQVREI